MHPRLNAAIALTLSLTLALMPLPGLADVAPRWQVPSASDTPVTLPQRIDPTSLPDFSAAALRAVALLDGFTLTDPPLEDRVLDLNLDPRAAFELVRDRVQSQAYNGQLRDPSQVFWAGAGNAHDKAATLAALLGRMGYDTRLVAGSTPSVPVDMTCDAAWNDKAWQLSGFGPSVLARINVRAQASYRALQPLLTPGAAPAQVADNHVWLQMRDGADWVNLDPWLPGTAWGDHPGGDGVPLTTPTPAHAVTLTLTVERLRDGQLQRDDIMQRRFDMPQANGGLITLIFGPKTAGVGGAMSSFLAQLQGGTAEFAATLLINGLIEVSAPFAAPGNAATETGFLADPAEAVTTALWLTLTSTAPGAPDHAETRAIFDLVPPDLRTAGAVIDRAALLPVAQQGRFPLALQGLRQIFLSNGGTSLRAIAARKALQMDQAPDVLVRGYRGTPDPWDTLWSSYLEVGRIAMASETLMRAKPDHQGACLLIDRPRVLTWGLVPVQGDGLLRWLDWTLDDVAVQGGSASAQAEQRLWHAAVQAAVEKEVLMYAAQGPADYFGLDGAPMASLAPDQTPAEAAQDQTRGYLTVADPAMPAGMWWRVDPVSGAADARLSQLGNGAGYFQNFLLPGRGALQGGTGTTTDLAGFIARAERDAAMRARLPLEKYLRIKRAEEQARAAEQLLERQKAAVQEYIMMAKVVMGFSLNLGIAIMDYNAVSLLVASEVFTSDP